MEMRGGVSNSFSQLLCSRTGYALGGGFQTSVLMFPEDLVLSLLKISLFGLLKISDW